MKNKFKFQFNFRQLMNKEILKVFLPGKWTLALFLVVFAVFFAWGTTFDKNSNPNGYSINIVEPGAISYSTPFPWHPTDQSFAVAVIGEIVPIMGQFNLLWELVDNSRWLGTYYTTLNYSFKDYLSILANYYCLLISLEAGVLFSISLFRKKVKEDKLWNSGSLILYRSIIIMVIVLIFYYGY